MTLLRWGSCSPPLPPKALKSPPHAPPHYGGGTFQISKSEKSPPRSPPNPKIWLKSPPHMGGSHFWAGRLRRPKIFRFPFENCQKSSKKPDFFRACGAKVLPPTMGGTLPKSHFGRSPHPSQSPPPAHLRWADFPP